VDFRDCGELMRRIRPIAALAVAVAALTVLIGCAPVRVQTHSVQQTIAEIREVPGVTHVSKVLFDDVDCEKICKDGSVVVSTQSKLTGAGLTALRGRILARIASDTTNSTKLIVTLQRGSDQIPLRASLGQYRLLETLRHQAPIVGVRLVTGLPSSVYISSRLSVVVASKTDILAGYEALQSAAAADRDFSATHTSIEARTNDYHYAISGGIAAPPTTLGPLSRALFANPSFPGVDIGFGKPGEQGSVFVRAATASAVPDAYVAATAAVAAYPDYRVDGSMCGNFQLIVDSSITPIDSSFAVVRMAAETGAHLGITVVQRQPGPNPSITFAVSSDADARLLNKLALAHPEFHTTLSDYEVTITAKTSVRRWSFGRVTGP
jgi:hypothetical protein